MEAGPSLHQMQPRLPSTPAPAPAARIPGQPPNGILRPPVIPGQRRGPVLTVEQVRTPIPPPMFQFQRVKKPESQTPQAAEKTTAPPVYMGRQKTMTTPPSAPRAPQTQRQRPPIPPPPAPPHVPVSELRRPPPRAPQHRTQQYYSQKSAYYAANPQTPSTSYSAPVEDYTPKPTYTTAEPSYQQIEVEEEQIYEIEGGEESDKLNEEKQSTMIELPPNCKLFQYSCTGNDGVNRTLLVPMPMNATQEDVMKMLPDSFPEIAAKIFQSEQPTTQEKVHTLSFPEGTSPSFEMMGGANEQETTVAADVTSPTTTSSAPNNSEESPILVNPKQYRRIISRRQMRQKLELSGRLPLQRQKYLHESRHLHAINRKRGHDGRFDPKLRQNASSGQNSETVTPKQYRAAIPPRQVTTYAEIRPAHDNSLVASSDNHSAAPTSSAGATSSAAGPPIYYHAPITNYQQYQQHVQYTEVPYSNSHVETTVVHNDNGETQNFTNL